MVKKDSTRHPYLRYGVILALIFAVRAFEASTSGAIWRAQAYDSSLWFWSVVILAFAICSIVTTFARSHYAPTITILLSVLAGATSTLVVSSILGMIVGVFVGVALTFDASRGVTFWVLRHLVSHGLPAAIVGVSLGFFGSLSLLLRVDPADQNRAAVVILILLGGLALIWSWLMAKWKHQRTATALLSAVFFFAATLVTEPLGIEIDSRRRIRAVQPDIYAYSMNLVPFGLQNLVRGWRGATELRSDRGFSAEAGESLQAFRNIQMVWLSQDQNVGRRRPFASAGFSKINFKAVNQLYAYHSGLNDEVLLAFKNSAGLRQLLLQSTRVTDHGLLALAGMPKLSRLDLSATDIDGSGLAHLHPQAPLTDVRLEATKVDDAALQHLAPFQLWSLVLRDTLVRGEGLRLLDKQSMVHLDLSHSQFREELIDSLLPGAYQTLVLDGIKLTKAGMQKIARIDALNSLSIVGSGVNDEAVALIKNLSRLETLNVDATNLSQASCDALAHVVTIQLSYDGSKTKLDEIDSSYRALQEELLRLKRQRKVRLPAQGATPVRLGIYNLVVDYAMVEKLKQLDCVMYNLRIVESDAEPQNGLEPDDLDRFFSRTGALLVE